LDFVADTGNVAMLARPEAWPVEQKLANLMLPSNIPSSSSQRCRWQLVCTGGFMILSCVNNSKTWLLVSAMVPVKGLL
jgi:hypothetical protein